MKIWENSEIVELTVAETAEGGRNLQQVDKLWTDVKTGELYSSYASGGDTTGEEFEVTKKRN